MSTSLAAQLQNLAVPQTTLLQRDKKRASILFDPKEAAAIDRDTFYDIGISGLRELIPHNPDFSAFEHTLFSVKSKTVERAVESKQTNALLDKNIKKFFGLLSPYFLLNHAHKALEWLVHRFAVHEYNKRDFLKLILPFHESNIFARCLQLLNIYSEKDDWFWLRSVQKAGIHLPKLTLLNHAANNVGFLKFVEQMVFDAVATHAHFALKSPISSPRVQSLTTLFTFYCTTTIGALEHSALISEPQITAILPALLKGLSSQIPDYTASAYMITAQLLKKTKLSHKILDSLVLKIVGKSQQNLRMEATLLLLLVYQSQQDHYVSVPTRAVIRMLNDDWFAVNLGKLAAEGSYVLPLFVPVLKTALAISKKGDSRSFVEKLVTEVRFDDYGAETTITTILKCHLIQPEETDNLFEDSDKLSDAQVTNWYGSLLNQLETRYPNAYDKITSKPTGKLKKSLNAIIHARIIANKKSDKSQFEVLYNTNAEIRASAVAFIVKSFNRLSTKDRALLRRAFGDRIIDDDVRVVKKVFRLQIDQLVKLIGEEMLSESIIKLLVRSTNNFGWRNVVKSIILQLNSPDHKIDLDQFLLPLLPYLFPNNTIDHSISKQILQLKLKKLPNIPNVQSINTPEELCTVLYESLVKNSQNCDLNFVLGQIKSFPKKTETHKYLFAVLLVANLPVKSSPALCNSVLAHITPHLTSCVAVPNNSVENYIAATRNEQLPLQGFLDLISIICDRVESPNLCNNWLNLSQPDDTIKFVINTLVHLLKGCSLKDQNIVLIYSKVLKQFLDKFFQSFEHKINFLANIITADNFPQLKLDLKTQLRIVNILNSLISQSSQLNWTLSLNSNILIPAVLIGLVHSVQEVRLASMQILDKISECKSSTENTYLPLIYKIVRRKDEILLDSEQLPLILFTALTKSKNPELQLIIKHLFEITADIKTPIHVTSSLLKVLTFVNSNEILETTSKLGLNILKPETGTLNSSSSAALYNIVLRFNESTAKSINIESTSWEFIVLGLKRGSLNVQHTLNKFSSPTVLILEQINRDVFANFNFKIQCALLKLLIEIATLTDNPDVFSGISKVVKQIDLDVKTILDDLEAMKDVKSTKSLPQRKFRRSEIPTLDILDTEEWKRGITILEFVQDKKKLTNINLLLPILFGILKKCLDFDEQGAVEYPKQIILSAILHCCNKLSLEGTSLPANSFNMELVVQCIRASQNPQTHHHALLVLAYTASLIPEQVLHNIMAIFTFMGSSVLRHDDAYSFQIISKIIDTIIPILIKGNEQDVTAVLRVFVDVILDVPEHRRIPLFKKLLTTLEVENYLYLFLLLIFEAHVVHGQDPKPLRSRLLSADAPKRLDIATNITLQFTPDVILKTCIKLLEYLKELPVDKTDNINKTFNISYQSPKQFRHYKYTLITFLSSFLSSKQLVNMIATLNNTEILEMEPYCKNMIISILTYIQSLSKTTNQMSNSPQAQYWKVLLHHCYDILDSINALLTTEMFLLVIRGLIAHNIPTVRRKAMEILNTKLQHLPSFFYTSPDDTEITDTEGLFALLPSIIGIIKTTTTEELDPELELSKQTALLTLKLLVKVLGIKHPDKFIPVLEYITELIKSDKIQGNVLASVVLCLSELVSKLRAHSIPGLTKFMPPVIKILKHQKQQESPGLLLMCLITAIQKIIESLPLFLSPYLEKLLIELTVLSTKWTDPKFNTFNKKLDGIRTMIGTTIPSRVLIPVINQTYETLLSKLEYDAVGPLMHVLAENLTNLRGQDLTSLLPDLTSFFLVALQFRAESLCDDVTTVEDHIIKTLSILILKLSETTFRPLYYRLYDWAIRSEARTKRVITFYRLSAGIAESLKGLFVLFAGHFVNNASTILDQCNNVKNTELYFDNEEDNLLLIQSILKTLNAVFVYDGQNFVDKDRFDTLMQPIVDQLENSVGGIEAMTTRASDLVIPCIAQFAVATGDDALWKQLNYQILLKTRHNLPGVRLIALDCVCEVARKVGEDFIPLLPETIPFLAELLEDEDEHVESACQKAVQDLEKILGEPLAKYF